MKDALADVAMSNTLIYWLNVSRGASADDPVPAMTRYTGGREYSIGNEHALERAITEIGEEIHGQYLIELHAGEYKRIRLPSHPRRR